MAPTLAAVRGLGVERRLVVILGGDAVLMSPACASLDMFDNYMHRARVFVEAVNSLAAEQGMSLEGGL